MAICAPPQVSVRTHSVRTKSQYSQHPGIAFLNTKKNPHTHTRVVTQKRITHSTPREQCPAAAEAYTHSPPLSRRRHARRFIRIDECILFQCECVWVFTRAHGWVGGGFCQIRLQSVSQQCGRARDDFDSNPAPCVRRLYTNIDLAKG